MYVAWRVLIVVKVKRLVIDALKSREESIIELSKALCEINGTEEVDITVTEVDARTETVKIVMRGSNINFDKISKVITDRGAIIRSIDEINVFKTGVE